MSLNIFCSINMTTMFDSWIFERKKISKKGKQYQNINSFFVVIINYNFNLYKLFLRPTSKVVKRVNLNSFRLALTSLRTTDLGKKVLEILASYESLLGLKINQGKTSIFFSKSTTEAMRTEIKEALGGSWNSILWQISRFTLTSGETQ